MTRPVHSFPLVLFARAVRRGAHRHRRIHGRPDEAQAPDIPLKEAKLNIEHNATDEDTGFQGFIDSEGWQRLDVTGPDGQVLTFEGRGILGDLGLTELFFETVEPENADVPIEEMLAKLPEGNYTISGPGEGERREPGPDLGHGAADARHPGGPELVSPAEDATVPTTGLVAELEAR